MDLNELGDNELVSDGLNAKWYIGYVNRKLPVVYAHLRDVAYRASTIERFWIEHVEDVESLRVILDY